MIPRSVKVATPLVVFIDVVPVSVPPPPVNDTVTVTPDWLTSVPPVLRSSTDGCAANATPLFALGDGCDVTASCVAGATRLMDDDVALVSPAPPNVMVYEPSGPERVIPVNVAIPEPSVPTVVVPLNAPPALGEALIRTFESGTALPDPSRNWTAGAGDMSRR